MQIKKSDSPLESYINSTPEISGKAFSEMLNPPRGIKFTIWENLSEIIGGFRMNEFSLLCGTTGTGKSDLIANISANLCLNQVHHLMNMH